MPIRSESLLDFILGEVEVVGDLLNGLLGEEPLEDYFSTDAVDVRETELDLGVQLDDVAALGRPILIGVAFAGLPVDELEVLGYDRAKRVLTRLCQDRKGAPALFVGLPVGLHEQVHADDVDPVPRERVVA